MSIFTIKSAFPAIVGAVASVGISASVGSAAPLGGYTFPNVGNLSPSGVAPGVTFSNFSYVGDGTSTNFPDGNGASPDKAYSANGFSDDATIDNSPGDGYFTFTITPNSGLSFVLNQLSFAVKPSGNDAPKNILVRYSTDSTFTAVTQILNQALLTKPNGNLDNVWQTLSANLNGATFTTPVNFRIYGYSTGPGRADNLDIDSVSVTGSAVPTPAVIPAMLGFGAGILRKRRLTKAQPA